MPIYHFEADGVLLEGSDPVQFAKGATGVLRPSVNEPPVDVYDMNGSAIDGITVGPLGAFSDFRADISFGVLDFGSFKKTVVSVEAQAAVIDAVDIAKEARDTATAAQSSANAAAANAAELAESALSETQVRDTVTGMLRPGDNVTITSDPVTGFLTFNATASSSGGGGTSDSLTKLVVSPTAPTNPTIGLVWINNSAGYTVAPPAPTGLVSSAGDRRVTLTWATVGAEHDVTAYRIFDRGTQVAEVTGTSYTLTGLTNGVAYTDITIRAVNRSGLASDPALFRAVVPATSAALYYVSSFNTDPIGTLPVGWSSIWSPTRSVAVAEVSPGRRALHFAAAGTNARTGVVYDAVPSSTGDIEVLARARFTGTEGVGGPLVRASGAAGTETGLIGRESITSRHLLAYAAGTATVITETATTIARDVWVWQRVRVVGTTLSYRIWVDGTPEPSTWTLTGSTTGYATAGKAGYFAFFDEGVFDVDYMSGALSGATAPLPVA